MRINKLLANGDTIAKIITRLDALESGGIPTGRSAGAIRTLNTGVPGTQYIVIPSEGWQEVEDNKLKYIIPIAGITPEKEVIVELLNSVSVTDEQKEAFGLCTDFIPGEDCLIIIASEVPNVPTIASVTCDDIETDYMGFLNSILLNR